ncbi:MAG: hypothetical protein Q9159_004730 [Coniocarpon cinnabarinum]
MVHRIDTQNVSDPNLLNAIILVASAPTGNAPLSRITWPKSASHAAVERPQLPTRDYWRDALESSMGSYLIALTSCTQGEDAASTVAGAVDSYATEWLIYRDTGERRSTASPGHAMAGWGHEPRSQALTPAPSRQSRS